jgi:nucleoside-diphosphate-sugar epimerase
VAAPPLEHDVARRIPATEKAARVLGFEATTSLSDMLDEVIPWIKNAMEEGAI